MATLNSGVGCTAVVIGGGRIGTALAESSLARGLRVPLVTRSAGWQALDEPAGVPVAVCVRNDDLSSVIARVPQQRRADLVFLQNGMMRPWLEQQGLSDASRGLLFFAVAQRGSPPVAGGSSPMVGRHAPAMAVWLQTLQLPAATVTQTGFAAVEVEKILWNCLFGLLCQVHGCAVGTVVEQHRQQVADLAAELLPLAGQACGADLELDPLVERLCAYSLAIGDYRGAVKEWTWRNGWFVQEAARRGVACPLHWQLTEGLGRPTVS